MSETSAWLIERHVNGIPEWLSVLEDEVWTTDVNIAIKFYSKATTDFWLYYLKVDRAFASEHMWCDSLLDEAKQRSRDLRLSPHQVSPDVLKPILSVPSTKLIA
jgi:hypothetical protein